MFSVNKMRQTLPPHVLVDIFKNISDYKTLYSCVLANRQFCRLAMPYLWDNPFAKLEGLTPLSTLRRFLNEDERFEIKVKAEEDKGEDKVGDNNNAAPPLFQYPKFIKTINLCCLKNCCKREFKDDQLKIVK